MTKHHHPISRAERLKLKEADGNIQYTKPTHAKKRIKESLKDKETRAQLREALDVETREELSRAALVHEYGTD